MNNMNIKDINCIKCGAKMKVHQMRCVDVNKEKKQMDYEVTYLCPVCKEKLKTNLTVHI